MQGLCCRLLLAEAWCIAWRRCVRAQACLGVTVGFPTLLPALVVCISCVCKIGTVCNSAAAAAGCQQGVVVNTDLASDVVSEQRTGVWQLARLGGSTAVWGKGQAASLLARGMCSKHEALAVTSQACRPPNLAISFPPKQLLCICSLPVFRQLSTSSCAADSLQAPPAVHTGVCLPSWASSHAQSGTHASLAF